MTAAPRPLPDWLRSLEATLAVHAQYVLWGNIRDLWLIPDDSAPHEQDAGSVSSREGPGANEPPPTRAASTLDALGYAFERNGYSGLLTWDPVHTLLESHPNAPIGTDLQAELGGVDLPMELSARQLPDFVAQVTRMRGIRSAIVIRDGSRLLADPASPREDHREMLNRCERLAREAIAPLLASEPDRALYNPVIWLLDHERDLPAWFTDDTNTTRVIPLGYPELDDRIDWALLQLHDFEDWSTLGDQGRARILDEFASSTEGMSLADMQEIIRLALDQRLAVDALTDAVRTYKTGLTHNPWSRGHLRERMSEGEKQLRKRVLGQDRAITKALDILKRSAMGLTGGHTKTRGSRPRGVLFFAGPTGVGKTELAKAITELVFGNEQAYSRFDMSEFAAEHSGERLIGAPPSYVGYDAGGELTNAVRQRPFSLLLFDEIEKAHGRILDKFLQVLEDGRLTDGQGRTVHFSEAILVFTSNLGVYQDVRDAHGNVIGREEVVSHGMAYEEVDASIQSAVADHFKRKLGRPELYNRFGDNVVVFDFINHDVGDRILDIFIDNVTSRVRSQHGIRVQLTKTARNVLAEFCLADLSQGGRGIASRLETTLVNPLSRALFDLGRLRNYDSVTIGNISVNSDDVYELEIA